MSSKTRPPLTIDLNAIEQANCSRFVTQTNKQNRGDEKKEKLVNDLNIYISELKNNNVSNVNNFISSAFSFLQCYKPIRSIDEQDTNLRNEIIDIIENADKTNYFNNLPEGEIKNKFSAMQKGIPYTLGGRKYKKSRKNTKKIRKSNKKIRKSSRKTAKKSRRR